MVVRTDDILLQDRKVRPLVNLRETVSDQALELVPERHWHPVLSYLDLTNLNVLSHHICTLRRHSVCHDALLSIPYICRPSYFSQPVNAVQPPTANYPCGQENNVPAEARP